MNVLKIMDAGYCLYVHIFMKNIISLKPINFYNSYQFMPDLGFSNKVMIHWMPPECQTQMTVQQLCYCSQFTRNIFISQSFFSVVLYYSVFYLIYFIYLFDSLQTLSQLYKFSLSFQIYANSLYVLHDGAGIGVVKEMFNSRAFQTLLIDPLSSSDHLAISCKCRRQAYQMLSLSLANFQNQTYRLYSDEFLAERNYVMFG